MSVVLDILSAWPEPAQVILLASAGAAIGLVLAQLASLGSSPRGVQLVLIVAPLVGLPAAASGILNRHAAGLAASETLDRLMQSDLNRAVLASDAATTTALRQKLVQTATINRSRDRLEAEARTLIAELTTERFNALAPDASDDAILDYQKLSLAVLEALKGHPERCVQFIDNSADFDAGLLPAALQHDVERRKARIVEEGARRLASFRTPLPADDLRQSLTIGYRMTGRDITSLARLADRAAPAPARCMAAMDYMTALSSLEAKRAARVFKTLLLSRSGAP